MGEERAKAGAARTDWRAAERTAATANMLEEWGEATPATPRVELFCLVPFEDGRFFLLPRSTPVAINSALLCVTWQGSHHSAASMEREGGTRKGKETRSASPFVVRTSLCTPARSPCRWTAQLSLFYSPYSSLCASNNLLTRR